MSTRMLAMMMKIAATSTVPWMIVTSPWPIASILEAADAGDVEDRLGEDRAAHQGGDVEAEHGDQGTDRRAHAVLEDDPALRKSLRARGPDVVLAHHLQEASAHQSRVDRALGGREDDPGHDQRLEPARRVHGQADVAAGAEEDVEAADVVGEQEQRHQPEPEHRAPKRRPGRRPSRRGRGTCAA